MSLSQPGRANTTRIVEAPKTSEEVVNVAALLATSLARSATEQRDQQQSAPVQSVPPEVTPNASVAVPAPATVPGPDREMPARVETFATASLIYPIATNYTTPDAHTHLSFNLVYGHIGVANAGTPANDAAAPLPSAATPVDAVRLAVPTPVLVPRGSALPGTPPSPSSGAELSQRTAPRPSYQIFRDAERLQYGRRDYAAALTAWDQYLAVEPNGALALEARFNRGVCLAGVGRSADAERALAPFAKGEYGQYRLQEARAVLKRLGITPGNTTHHSTVSTQPR